MDRNLILTRLREMVDSITRDSAPLEVGIRRRDLDSPRSLTPAQAPSQELKPTRCEKVLDGPLSITFSVYQEGVVPGFYRLPDHALKGLSSCEPGLSEPGRWLFLDVETTGLSGAATVAFLVGLGCWQKAEFHLTQYLLLDRAGEEALLSRLIKDFADRPALVTFNGKCFDVPLLEGRFAMNGVMDPGLPERHLDLLSLVRNMGKPPGHRQTLTGSVRRFLGTIRQDDVPGQLIPGLYFMYEKGQDVSILEPVIKHNRLDVLDMVCLLRVFADVLTGEPGSGDRYSLGGAGKLHLRKGNLDMAHSCLTATCETDRPQDVTHLRALGHVLRRRRDWTAAAHVWEQVLGSGSAGYEDYLWLARCYELSSGDLEKSLDVVERALALHGHGRGAPALLRRKGRLDRLMAKRAR